MSSQSLSAASPAPDDRLGDAKIPFIIGASAVGTMIEWYDFYIFGSLASVIALHFYPKGNATAALLATLATFGAGFAARPFGALFFGRIGDIIGRKYAFLVTLLMMGGATFLIGLLPGYDRIGLAAPIILVTIRVLQGLALGGEYGGAAIYVAEHVPDHKRGFYTSFIQTTATLGLFVSLLVILAVRQSMSTASWEAWGWRLPFLLSIVLVVISLMIRLRLKESPLFARIKTEGKTSKAPIHESFGSKAKWQTILLVLWGAAAGQAVVWYTGQFYALSWLQGKTTANVPFVDSNWIIAVALALATPFFIVFGALSDRIGRKTVMMAGNLLGAIFTIPLFYIMRQHTPVEGNYNPYILTACVFVLVLFVTMVYGPIAAFLAESFPSRVRYTSVSLPYHIANGYFGGFLPLIATAVVVRAEKNPDLQSWAPYMGLLYPVTVAAITFVVGTLLLRETKDNTIERIETRQREYSPAVFGGLVALSAVALVAADQFLTPTLNTATFNVQWFFRILALVVAVAYAIMVLRRREAEEEEVQPEPVSGD
ncbi:MAG: MHS family MFS transporter [Thermomicrobiaceae bacterium]|nr:MHS family MFS transporter [Thermomicrobiaceae bacterium]